MRSRYVGDSTGSVKYNGRSRRLIWRNLIPLFHLLLLSSSISILVLNVKNVWTILAKNSVSRMRISSIVSGVLETDATVCQRGVCKSEWKPLGTCSTTRAVTLAVSWNILLAGLRSIGSRKGTLWVQCRIEGNLEAPVSENSPSPGFI